MRLVCLVEKNDIRRQNIARRVWGGKVLTPFAGLVPVLSSVGFGVLRYPAPEPTVPPAVLEPLQGSLLKTFDDLLRIAPQFEYSPSQIEGMCPSLDQARKLCAAEFEAHARRCRDHSEAAKSELDRRSKELKGPPFFEGMVRTQREILYLPSKEIEDVCSIPAR